MKTTLLSLAFFLLSIFSFTASAQTSNPCTGCDYEPLCVIEDEGFRFEYFGAINQGNGTTQLKFKVFNASRYPFTSIMFDLPGTNIPAISPKTSYVSRFWYSVDNNYNQEFIKFIGLNTTTYRYDQSDIFRYTVDSATFYNGQNSTIEIQAEAGDMMGIAIFDLNECDDLPINPLPVELTSFKGNVTAAGVSLTWETASEKNNAYFSVQYSTDGRNFESVGYVQGNGTTAMAHKYAFTHKDPAGGKVYYRLKQVDHDNTSAYSKVIVLETKTKANLPLRVYPNPVTGQEVNLQFENVSAEKVNLTLTDLNGRVILKRTTEAARNVKFDLNGADLKPGIYILNVQADLQTAHQKIVVQ
ncbi:T9SS type A sorting domain-containing protein [Adhaeribacter terreus]|uniref:T9SS type A sorting domain-containing protein n=1 Tax=Adhaeribacter terreus TaxID=529703 RepID=A0ABW0EG32_9BACT